MDYKYVCYEFKINDHRGQLELALKETSKLNQIKSVKSYLFSNSKIHIWLFVYSEGSSH